MPAWSRAFRARARLAAEETLDAIYPPRCRLCGQAAFDGFACGDHTFPTEPAGPRCGRCAAALAPALPDGTRCSPCRLSPPAFQQVVALADYRRQAEIQPWILALKHGGRPDLAQPLAQALGERFLDAAAPQDLVDGVLVPVPLHPLRRLERGYDQALLLARALEAVAGVPALRLLVRSRRTPAQGAPGSVSREANVRGAFRMAAFASRRLRGRRVWLVDDVVTSGATASECARVLGRAGASAVRVLCLARAGQGGNQAVP